MKVKNYTTWLADMTSYWQTTVSGASNVGDLTPQISSAVSQCSNAVVAYKGTCDTSLHDDLDSVMVTYNSYVIINDVVTIEEYDSSGAIANTDLTQSINWYITDLPDYTNMFTYTITDIPVSATGTLTENQLSTIITTINGYHTIDSETLLNSKENARSKIAGRTNYHVTQYTNFNKYPVQTQHVTEGKTVRETATDILNSTYNLSTLTADFGYVYTPPY